MRGRLGTCLILGGLIMALVRGSLALADNAERIAEMQKALNAEVLAQPFRVATPMERPVAAQPPQPQSPVPSCAKPCGRSVVYPRLSLGWYYGHRPHRFGWHGGHRAHRYRRH